MIYELLELLLRVFSYVISIHWSIVSVFAILGLIGFAAYRPRSADRRYGLAELVIVSKACNEVRDVLMGAIRHHRRVFKCPLNVVIDEGSPLQGELAGEKEVRLVVVPKSFRSKAVAKGRAIHYFIQTRVRAHKFYLFLDDDNLLLDDRVFREIPYYLERGYVAVNGVLVPRRGDSLLSHIADYLRMFDDLTVFRFATGLLKKPINGFHGELLGATGKVLKEIGFDRKTVTEDFSFAVELERRGYKVWQSDSRISILSPHSVSDFLKQRNRWYRGISGDVAGAGASCRLFAGLRVTDWKVGLLGSWAIFPLWFFMPVPFWWSVFNMIGAAYYYAAYLYGSVKTGTFWPFLLAPIYSTMENLAPHVSNGNGRYDFPVINKNNNHSR